MRQLRRGEAKRLDLKRKLRPFPSLAERPSAKMKGGNLGVKMKLENYNPINDIDII
jgi:hypothetical protein